VQIVFGRKITAATPGRFRTRILTNGVHPQLHAYYKHSKVKQYFKHGRALRTETIINDAGDFRVGRTLNATNWLSLTRIGHETNQRLLAAQLAACDCAPDSTTLHQVVSPSTHDGLPAPALRFGDERVMALLSSLCSYRHLFDGLTNRSLRELVAGLIPGYSPRRMTYDLRRLRRKGLIRRAPGSQHYELTDHGRRIRRRPDWFLGGHTWIRRRTRAGWSDRRAGSDARRNRASARGGCVPAGARRRCGFAGGDRRPGPGVLREGRLRGRRDGPNAFCPSGPHAEGALGG
jgi:hypothetical protein